jgi:pilus assembly protein CpaB
MSTRIIILVAVNVILVGATIVALRLWMFDPDAETVAAEAVQLDRVLESQVLVASENLNPGVILQTQHFEWQEWPEDGVSKSYYSYFPENDEDGAAEEKEQSLVGSVVRFGIPSGQPMVSGAIVSPGDRGFLAAILEPGYRAMSIQITASTSSAGLILPGDRVDVIMSHRFTVEDEEGKDHPRRVAETILLNIRTLAIDQNVASDTSDIKVGKTATLQVTPRQAERLALAQDMGELSLSLRGIDEHDTPGDLRRTTTWDYNASLALGSASSANATSDKPTVFRGGKP